MFEAAEQLYFAIGLVDKVSGPAGKVTGALRDMHNAALRGGMLTSAGWQTMKSTTQSMMGFIEPANQMGNALERLNEAGMSQKGLSMLRRQADDFATRFGMDAMKIVESAEYMKNNVSGLSEEGVLSVAKNAGLLAKAGNTSIDGMNELYKQAATSARAEIAVLGDAKWADMFASKVAAASRKAGVTIAGLTDSMRTLGNTGYNLGMSTSDQFGIMATLQQGGMNSSEAGAGLENMLSKSMQLKAKLGVDVYDQDGNVRNMNAIIADFKRMAGNSSESAIRAGLGDMFGEKSPAANAIFTLMKNSDKLKENLAEVGNTTGMDDLTRRAAANADSFDRFNQVVRTLVTNIGFSLMPALEIGATVLGSMGNMFAWCYKNCAPLRWIITALALTIGTLVLAWGALQIEMGATSILNLLILKLRVLNVVLTQNGIITNRMTMLQKAAAVANFLWSKSLGSTVLWSHLATAATWLFSAALWANPITWVVAGVVALIAALVLLVKYWDKVKAAAVGAFDWIFNNGCTVVALLLDRLAPGIQMVGLAFGLMKDLGASAWNNIKSAFQGIGGIVGKTLRMLAKVPGLGFLATEEAPGQAAAQPVVPAATSARKTDVAAGGITNTRTTNNNWGGVTINAQQGMGPGALEEWAAMQA